jgi:hypothetical protein
MSSLGKGGGGHGGGGHGGHGGGRGYGGYGGYGYYGAVAPLYYLEDPLYDPALEQAVAAYQAEQQAEDIAERVAKRLKEKDSMGTGLDFLGSEHSSVEDHVHGGAWFSGSDEAKAGIRAVRAMQAQYAQILAARPDAAKYQAQVSAIVAGADKWEKAWVFYTNDDAVNLGREAVALSQVFAKEYGTAPVTASQALAPGVIERAQQAAEKGADAFNVPTWVWWAGGAVVASVVLGPVVAPLIASRVVRR